ncbi:MAG TPA: hypothetical protein VHD31_01755 [Candidatus Paceibacterota bacterium]|nr:hypothetical protein [Candidatus Paceibacterota bacterium]
MFLGLPLAFWLIVGVPGAVAVHGAASGDLKPVVPSASVHYVTGTVNPSILGQTSYKSSPACKTRHTFNVSKGGLVTAVAC